MKLGIIGCGNIVGMHVRHIDCTPVRVTCVLDVQEDRARAMAGRLGCDWTTDRSALLARRDVEAVLIATPNSDHAASTLAALNAGKHVLCEKPIVRTIEEGVTVVKAVRQAKTLFQTAFMRRCHPGYMRLRELVRDEIGEIQHVRIRNTGAVAEKDWLPAQSRKEWLAASGGYLSLSGCHSLDVMRWILGEPLTVAGRTRSWTSLPTDTYTTALFAYDNIDVFYETGLHRVQHVGEWRTGWEDTWEVVGAKARVYLSMPDWDRYEENRPILRIQWNDGKVEEPFVPACDYYGEQLKQFTANIAAGKTSPDVDDGFRAQALIEAIRAATQTRQTVAIVDFYKRA